jgi:hypothetical protein
MRSTVVSFVVLMLAVAVSWAHTAAAQEVVVVTTGYSDDTGVAREEKPVALFLDRPDGLVELVMSPGRAAERSGAAARRDMELWMDGTRAAVRSFSQARSRRSPRRGPVLFTTTGLRLWVAETRRDDRVALRWTWDDDTAAVSAMEILARDELDSLLERVADAASRRSTIHASNAADTVAARHPARAALSSSPCPPIDTLLADERLARFAALPALGLAFASRGPRFPPGEHRRARSGHVVASVVIDTTGYPMKKTYETVSSDSRAFADAVRKYVDGYRAHAAEVVPGCPVRQRVRFDVSFVFRP